MLLSEKFVSQMEKELENNQNKGNWSDWHPNKDSLLSELKYHVEKLELAICSNDKEKVKEYSADVANFSEKAFTEFG